MSNTKEAKHLVATAWSIQEARVQADGSAWLISQDKEIKVSKAFVDSNPAMLKGPGFYSLFEDGYMSWTPLEVWRAEGAIHNFAWASSTMQAGNKVLRGSWPVGTYIFYVTEWAFITAKEIEVPIENQPFIAMVRPNGHIIPWPVTHSDLFATDWEILAQDEKEPE